MSDGKAVTWEIWKTSPYVLDLKTILKVNQYHSSLVSKFQLHSWVLDLGEALGTNGEGNPLFSLDTTILCFSAMGWILRSAGARMKDLWHVPLPVGVPFSLFPGSQEDLHAEGGNRKENFIPFTLPTAAP